MGSSGSSDFDQMADHADARCAAAMDALIDDLPRPEHVVIYHVHTGCMLPSWITNMEPIYISAKQYLAGGLSLKGIW